MTAPARRARLELTPLEDRTTPAAFTPAMIRQAYSLDFNLSAADGRVVAADGTGQTIAIIDAYHDPNVAADLAAFDLTYGLTDPLFLQIGQHLDNPGLLPATPPADDQGWYGEAALDVEWAHAVAPGAAILLVEADSSSLADMNAALDTARQFTLDGLPPVSVISMSFGTPSEYAGERYDDTLYTTPAGHAGITFVAATGDDYGYGGYSAYSPNVLAVGGSRLTTDAAGNWLTETPWKTLVDGQVVGSAGGYSLYEPQPYWQNGVQKTGRRGIPDVSYNADPQTGFYVYDTATNPLSPWSVVGGTSAATPQWAGIIALANQGRALSGRTSLDGGTQTLPYIYGLPDSAFHVLARAGNAPKWNVDTGRGSPIASRVVSGLLVGSGVSVVGPGVTPSVSPVGGPVAPEPFAVGADAGAAPVVRVYNPDGTPRLTFTAYEPDFTGGVRVAVADVTGDGVEDVVVAPGPGRAPEVRVYNAETGALEVAFTAFETDFQGGVNLTTGAVGVVGRSAIVVAADEGGGPRVRVIDALTGNAVADFYGIDDPAFRGGARVAVGDVNRDGTPDLIVAAGFGGGPRVSIYDGRTLTTTPTRLVNDFYAFPGPDAVTLRDGAFVAAGDFDGDQAADLAFGGGPGGGPRVLILSGADVAAENVSQPKVLANFYAGDATSRSGVRLAATEVDGDGLADLLVGAGPGSSSRVIAYTGRALAAGSNPAAALSLDPFAGSAAGVNVG
jgi:hypothetical protein